MMAEQMLSPRVLRGMFAAKTAARAAAKPTLAVARDDTDAQLLHEYLWKETEAIRQDALQTQFIQRIQLGKLNPSIFGGYMVQDCVYCHKTTDSIRVARDRAVSEEVKDELKDMATSYDKYTKKLFKKWHIDDAEGISLGSAAAAYAEYVHSVAANESQRAAYFMVALLPCAWLWPWIGQQIGADSQDPEKFGVYHDWVTYNFYPDFGTAETIQEIIDSENLDWPTALGIFTRCMQGEVNFFASAHEFEL